MFKENIGLAKYIAYSYYKLNDNFTYEDYEDLKQEAIIELWKASIDYKNIGYKFQTYANKRIRRRLYHILNSKRVITQDNIKGTYEVDFDKNLMLCEISQALDKIKVDNSYVKSDIGKYATILKLEGATDTEIAKILDKTPKQIDNAIQRIRVKLKKLR